MGADKGHVNIDVIGLVQYAKAIKTDPEPKNREPATKK